MDLKTAPMGEPTMGLKKKVLISCAIAFVSIVAIVLVVLFAPLPMPVDWDSLYNVGSDVELLAPGAEGNTTGSVALVKKDASDWKILQFTDMHLSEQNTGDWSNDRTMKEYVAAIERERPDFVALTGDIITSFRGRARAVQLCEVMEKLGVYWAYGLGNHEGDEFYKMSRKELMEIVEKYPHCLSDSSVKKTKTGEEVWGYSNFVVNLMDADHNVKQSLIFMDSGDAISDAAAERHNVEKDTYDYLKESQKTWYKEQVYAVTNDLTNGVKTMLFIHIPLVEQRNMMFVNLTDEDTLKAGWSVDAPADGWTYVDAAPAVKNGKVIGKCAVKEGWNACKGTANYEGVCSSEVNNGMYALMKEMRVAVNGLFCGHDHVNNSVMFEPAGEGETPIYLAYGVCSGYATYNLYKNDKTDDPNNLLKGYSVITVHANGTFDYVGVSYDQNYERSPYVVNSLPYKE